MKKADVKDWPDLVRYAEFCARRSARRGDPIAWAYWKSTGTWATDARESPLNDRSTWAVFIKRIMSVISDIAQHHPTEAARYYSRAKWLRIMSLNAGDGIVKPLSLRWLKGLEKVA